MEEIKEEMEKLPNINLLGMEMHPGNTTTASKFISICMWFLNKNKLIVWFSIINLECMYEENGKKLFLKLCLLKEDIWLLFEKCAVI